MSIDEFFEKLPRDGWWLSPSRAIESDDGTYQCPFLVVMRGVEAPRGPFGGSDSIYDSWRPIFKAADNERGHNPTLRARLLEHCGLREAQ